MPVLKTRCPECDAGLRLTVAGAGEHEMECPKCGHAFTATLGTVDRPTRYGQKGAGTSKTPLVVGAVAGGLLVVGGIVALAFAFSGPDKKPVAQADPPAKAAPAPVRPNPNPLKLPTLTPEPQPVPMLPVGPPDNAPADPPVGPPVVGLPIGPPDLPPAGIPALPGPAEDVFALAATFKPVGPLPELPPLPPVERRPMLALDPGGHTAFVRFVGFTPDATKVVSVSEDKSVRLWDVSSGEVVYTVRLPAGPDIEGQPFSTALSPDGTRLAVGVLPLGRGKAGIPVYVLSVETGELLATVDGARQVVTALELLRGRQATGRRVRQRRPPGVRLSVEEVGLRGAGPQQCAPGPVQPEGRDGRDTR